MEMAETTENENIDRVDIFESVDYSYKITVADGAKLVINAAQGYKRTISPIRSNLASLKGKVRKYEVFVFTFSNHFCGCHFQPFKPEKELMFSLRQVFVYD